MNMFRCTPDGKLDRQYLRVCAVYRLMKAQRIGKARAIALLNERRVPVSRSVVELWMSGPFKRLSIAA